MRRLKAAWGPYGVAVLGTFVALVGVVRRAVPAAAAALIGLGYCLVRRVARPHKPSANKQDSPQPAPAVRTQGDGSPERPADLVERMLAEGRYALLLRRQIAAHLDAEHFRRAVEALETEMALVPDGEVVLGPIDEALEDGQLEDAEILAASARVVRVQHFFLDRYPVTNEQFYRFVAAGGYEQAALWDESILPALLHFVDRTGHPGPAYWRHGRYPPGRERHPVVGICWYEAAAYARWVGKRLPTDAEWVKAASWPVKLSATVRTQRRYPWGDAMDYRRANLWGAGCGGTVPVDDFPGGVSVGGVYQLIGNVWEWTLSDFRPGDWYDGQLLLDVPMKTIRGGAFDTYFDNQATCQFQSGEAPLARKPNIGFRCAVGVCDLMLSCQEAAEEKSSEEPSPTGSADSPSLEVPTCPRP